MFNQEVDSLKKMVKKWKSNNKKIVFCIGSFDLFHSGHSEYLNEAKKIGDVLVVGVLTDERISWLKGVSRPIISENNRLSVVSSVSSVDFAFILKERMNSTSCDKDIKFFSIVNLVNPDFWIISEDHKGKFLEMVNLVKPKKTKIIIKNRKHGISTSDIIRKIKGNKKQLNIFSKIKKRLLMINKK